MSNNPIVKCPTCQKRGQWFADQYGPFCSKKCKLVDLGKWFNEEQKISGPLRPEHINDMSDEDVNKLVQGGGLGMTEAED